MSEDRRAPAPEKTGSLGVIEQMIFAELQRTREGNDKILVALAGLDKSLALVSSELAHVRLEAVRRIAVLMGMASGWPRWRRRKTKLTSGKASSAGLSRPR